MPAQPSVFISASSRDLKLTREQVKETLKTLGLKPMEDLPSEKRLQAILHGIAASDVVIHLAGMASGEVPSELVLRDALIQWEKDSPGFAGRLGLRLGETISYTQLEARLAYALGKPVHALVLADGYPYDDHPSEPAALRALQKAHRMVLRGVAPQAIPPHTLAELKNALNLLPIVRTSISSASRRRMAMAAAAVIVAGALIWAAGEYFPLGKSHSSYPSQYQPEDLALKLADATFPHEMPGVITTADQRYKNAEATVAAQTKVSVEDLRSTLDQFAEGVHKNPQASNYEQALAAFVQKNYHDAEKFALLNAPPAEAPRDGLPPDGTKPSRKAQRLAVDAQVAQNHFTDAWVTFRREAPWLADGEQLSGADSLQRTFRGSMLQSLVGAYGIAWDTLRSMVEDGANDYGKTGARFTPDDEFAIRGWAAVERSAMGKANEALSAVRRLETDVARVRGQDNDMAKEVHALQFSMLISDGQFTEVDNEFEEAAKKPAKSVSADDPNATRLAMLKSQLYLATGNLKEAMRNAEAAAVQRAKVLGDDHPATAEALSQQALVYRAQGSLVKAEAAQKKALEIMSRCFSERDRPMLTERRRLAMIWFDEGHLKQAELALKECYKIETQTIVDDDPDLSRTGNCLAAVFSDEGAFEGALDHGKAALVRIQRVMRSNAPLQGEIYTTLGQIYMRTGDLQSAAHYTQKGMDLLDRHETQHSPALARCLMVRSEFLHATGLPQEAGQSLGRAQNIMSDSGATHHPAFGYLWLDIAALQAAENRFDLAMESFEAGQLVMKVALPADHWRFAWADWLRACLMEGMGKEDEAIALGREALEHYRKLFPDWTQRLNGIESQLRGWEMSKQRSPLQPEPGETRGEYLERLRELRRKMQPKKPAVQV